jgi:hypothetical protein
MKDPTAPWSAPLRRSSTCVAIAMALGLCGGFAASAQAADAFTDAVQLAYAPYRAALFRTNAGTAAEAAAAVAQGAAAWQAVVDRFERAPPPPYDRDPAFASTLSQVGEVYRRAGTEVAEGRLPAAHETLEAARDLMAELRRRNGVVTYSDHMNAYHAAMEQVLIDGARLLAGPRGPMLLMAQVGVLEHLAARLGDEAPEALRAQPTFAPALAAVRQSVDRLKTALLEGDAAAAQDAIKALKGPYSRMFLAFG